jgi:hypothetical protein
MFRHDDRMVQDELDYLFLERKRKIGVWAFLESALPHGRREKSSKTAEDSP